MSWPPPKVVSLFVRTRLFRGLLNKFIERKYTIPTFLSSYTMYSWRSIRPGPSSSVNEPTDCSSWQESCYNMEDASEMKARNYMLGPLVCSHPWVASIHRTYLLGPPVWCHPWVPHGIHRTYVLGSPVCSHPWDPFTALTIHALCIR